VALSGFTTVVAVHFGPDGLLYALELSDAPGFPTPGAGKVVRVKHSGQIEEVITQLNVPTGMTFAADGRLYVSDFGAVPAPTFGSDGFCVSTSRRPGETIAGRPRDAPARKAR
jgi:hypothetical protein